MLYLNVMLLKSIIYKIIIRPSNKLFIILIIKPDQEMI